MKNYAKNLILFLFFFLVLMPLSTAQLKLDENGNIGIGTTTTAYEKLRVNGDVRILGDLQFGSSTIWFPVNTTIFGLNVEYSVLKTFEDAQGNCGIRPYSAIAGSIGSSNYQFYKIYGRYIFANQTPVESDKRLKTNFKDIETPLDKIKLVKGQKYDYKTDYVDTIKNEKVKKEVKLKSKNRLGFIAQELIEAIPEAVIYEKDNDTYYIDYNAIIPVLAEAIKEQQIQIEELQASLEVKNSSNDKLKSETIEDEDSEDALTIETELYQNIPNPFSENTIISYQIAEDITDAALYIYDMNGTQIKKYTLNQRGVLSTTINGSELNAGMYLYSLIADGQIIDTKRMVLTD